MGSLAEKNFRSRSECPCQHPNRNEDIYETYQRIIPTRRPRTTRLGCDRELLSEFGTTATFHFTPLALIGSLCLHRQYWRKERQGRKTAGENENRHRYNKPHISEHG